METNRDSQVYKLSVLKNNIKQPINMGGGEKTEAMFSVQIKH
jgi:hypothetical protein